MKGSVNTYETLCYDIRCLFVVLRKLQGIAIGKITVSVQEFVDRLAIAAVESLNKHLVVTHLSHIVFAPVSSSDELTPQVS
jgi:hypothetical protein